MLLKVILQRQARRAWTGIIRFVIRSNFPVVGRGGVNVKVKCTLVEALRLCTGRTAQRVGRRH